MPFHRAVQVQSTGAPLTVVDVDNPPLSRDHVRVTVSASGVCGTDHIFINGGVPGLSWPLTPGHEIAGTIIELGDGVTHWAVGERVAVGWFGGHCNHCIPCRKGEFIYCANGQVPSWHYPGGYAETVTVPANALARIPDELGLVEAAPMACAGVTAYHALRSTKALPGDRVAILGVGGVGHLGVQFAEAMGFETIAIARGTAKGDDARRLGAHHYIDSTAADVSEALQALGGASVVLATASNSRAIAESVGGLTPGGALVIIGAATDPLPIEPIPLIQSGISVIGHTCGTARDIEETMQFAVLAGVRAWIQEWPLGQAADAYTALNEGRARYRMVLTM